MGDCKTRLVPEDKIPVGDTTSHLLWESMFDTIGWKVAEGKHDPQQEVKEYDEERYDLHDAVYAANGVNVCNVRDEYCFSSLQLPIYRLISAVKHGAEGRVLPNAEVGKSFTLKLGMDRYVTFGWNGKQIHVCGEYQRGDRPSMQGSGRHHRYDKHGRKTREMSIAPAVSYIMDYIYPADSKGDGIKLSIVRFGKSHAYDEATFENIDQHFSALKTQYIVRNLEGMIGPAGVVEIDGDPLQGIVFEFDRGTAQVTPDKIEFWGEVGNRYEKVPEELNDLALQILGLVRAAARPSNNAEMRETLFKAFSRREQRK